MSVGLLEVARVELSREIVITLFGYPVQPVPNSLYKSSIKQHIQPLINVFTFKHHPIIVRNHFRLSHVLNGQILQNSLISLCHPLRRESDIHTSRLTANIAKPRADYSLPNPSKSITKHELALTNCVNVSFGRLFPDGAAARRLASRAGAQKGMRKHAVRGHKRPARSAESPDLTAEVSPEA